MFRNSLNQVPGDSTTMEEAGDEYYEFDGAKLEIKHNTSIKQSSVSIGPKITTHSGYESSVMEGSDSINSPTNPPGTSEMAESTSANNNPPGKFKDSSSSPFTQGTYTRGKLV